MKSSSNQINVASHIKMLIAQQTLDMAKQQAFIHLVGSSSKAAEEAIATLKDIFKKEKSCKIFKAVKILKSFVINSGTSFHDLANDSVFQKSILGLLNRLRGKNNIFQSINSNLENWKMIEHDVLCIIMTWAQAYAENERSYPNIVNNYRILRSQKIEFPPRDFNEEIYAVVQYRQRVQQNEKQKKEREQSQRKKKEQESKLDLDALYLKISFIKQEEKDMAKVLRLIKQIKSSIEVGKANPEEEDHWEKIKEMAIQRIQAWQSKNLPNLYKSSIKAHQKSSAEEQKIIRPVYLDLSQCPQTEDVANTSLDDDTKEDWYNADEQAQQCKKQEELKDINLVDL